MEGLSYHHYIYYYGCNNNTTSCSSCCCSYYNDDDYDDVSVKRPALHACNHDPEILPRVRCTGEMMAAIRR